MVRYATTHKDETHQKIVATAGRMFRKNGYLGAGVQKIMKAVGLTQGGFYAHFNSKDELLAETISDAFAKNREVLFQGLEDKSGREWFVEMVRRLISRAHRDQCAEACPSTSMTADIARSGKKVKRVFEEELLRNLKRFEEKVPSTGDVTAREKAITVFALSVGAVILSRAVADPNLSDEILKTARTAALRETP